MAYDESSPAVIGNKGFHLAGGPLLVVPTSGRPVGIGADLELRYGIGVDPIILAPAVRLGGYFASGHLAFMATPMARLTIPAGPVAPYLTGGAGLGLYLNSVDEGADRVEATGLAVIGGGGVMVHFGSVVAVGAEVTYQTITSSGFDAVVVGPAVVLGL
jgi:hypothetical protein